MKLLRVTCYIHTRMHWRWYDVKGEDRDKNLLVSHFEQLRMSQPQSVTKPSAEPASQSQRVSASQEPVTDWRRGLAQSMNE